MTLLTLNPQVRERIQSRLADNPVLKRITAEKAKAPPQIVVEKTPTAAAPKPNPNDVLRLFSEKWPQLFSPPDYAPMRALKLKIHQDIIDRLPDLKPRVIASALHRYCANPGYRRLLQVGATRFDLDGLPVGVVAEGDQATAPKVDVLVEKEISTPASREQIAA